MKKNKIILSIFVVLTFWCDGLFSQTKSRIAIGPYVQNVTDEKATICWSTLLGQSIVINPDSSKQIPSVLIKGIY